MDTDREGRSAVVLLSSVVVMAVIGCLTVVYVALKPLFDAAMRALTLP